MRIEGAPSLWGFSPKIAARVSFGFRLAPWRCRVSTRLEGQTMSTQSSTSTAIPKLLASADVALIIGKSEITIKNWIYRRKPSVMQRRKSGSSKQGVLAEDFADASRISSGCRLMLRWQLSPSPDWSQ